MPPSDTPSSTPFATLSPDTILDAIDAAGTGAGFRASGQLFALNSYENRVFLVGLEPSATGSDSGPAAPPPSLVAKFYRPGRWSDAQIREEHAFAEALDQAEVPAVPPLRLNGETLHSAGEFRYALFARRGGRTPELFDAAVRERIGRFLGRLHAVGARQAFATRIRLDAETYGAEPGSYLLRHDWLPPELAEVYRGLLAHALDGVRQAFDQVRSLRWQRIHGDCHPGNILWSEASPEPGPYFVDFDDCVTGPAVQDLWMLLSGDRAEQETQLRDVLAGYEMFARFDRDQLVLIEALRTLRLIHYSAWIARRWDDPAFPAAFPWFETPRYWEERILELREQIAAMQEPALAP